MQVSAIKNNNSLITNDKNLSFKELNMADIKRQLARRNTAPKNPEDIIWHKIVKEDMFRSNYLDPVAKVKAYLNNFIFDRNINIYYKDFETVIGQIIRPAPHHDTYIKEESVSPPRIAAACMLDKDYTRSPDLLRDNLCALASNPNVDVSEYSIRSCCTFTSEIACRLLRDYQSSINTVDFVSHYKLGTARDFIKTVTQRDDYNSASRDLYKILEYKEFSEDMYDIINMLMEHKSFDPNYIDNYYDPCFAELQPSMAREPQDALAYRIVNFEADMKEKLHYIPDNAHFFKKLCSNPNFDLDKATDKIGLVFISNNDMYNVFSNWETGRKQT